MVQENIIYYITEEDLQTVAEDEISRRLSRDEIDTIAEIVPNKVKWYDSIADAINEYFSDNK